MTKSEHRVAEVWPGADLSPQSAHRSVAIAAPLGATDPQLPDIFTLQCYHHHQLPRHDGHAPDSLMSREQNTVGVKPQEV